MLKLRTFLLVLLLTIGASLWVSPARAQNSDFGTSTAESVAGGDRAHAGDSGRGNAAHEGIKGDTEGVKSPFDPHEGSLFNPIVRMFTGASAPTLHASEENPTEKHVDDLNKIRYDYVFVTALVLLGLGIWGTRAGRSARVRPEGKPHSATNLFEAAVEGFQEYLVGIMGRDMARRYTPLIATFFLTIIICNWLGLVPGLVAPTSNANIPVALAIVAFFATHIIAIREAGLKSWAMHFVGEPLWLAPLNLPLHLVGELIKPVSLAIRLLCNVFGEEMVVVQLTLLGISVLPIWLPIPLQFPIMCLGVFFGALQALVFSTLLAIYISVLATHHDDHSDGHEGHIEHGVVNGHPQVITRSTESTLA